MFAPRFAFFVPVPIGGLLVALLLGWVILIPILAAVAAGAVIWFAYDAWQAYRARRREAAREAELFGPRHSH
jgi:hypothetical protein